jgi:hypothetical protein
MVTDIRNHLGRNLGECDRVENFRIGNDVHAQFFPDGDPFSINCFYQPADRRRDALVIKIEITVGAFD